MVVMTVAAANLPPDLKFVSCLPVCHKSSRSFMDEVWCAGSIDSFRNTVGGENAWLCLLRKSTI